MRCLPCFHCHCLRCTAALQHGPVARLAYAYMAASWGGYILVLTFSSSGCRPQCVSVSSWTRCPLVSASRNMVGLHAGLLMLLGSEGQLYAVESPDTGL